MMSTRLYSYPPFCTKNPFGPCTLAIATAMVPSTNRLASGVSRPSRYSSPAASSPPTARAAQNRAGRKPRLPMNPVAPAKPGPPNAPNAFCVPWPRNTRPSASRRANNPRSATMLHLRDISRIRDTLIRGTIRLPRRFRRMMASKTTVPGDTGLMLWVVLARAFDAVERHSRASIARFDLGTTEFGVLEVLYHKGELPVCEVQRRILVESSSTTYVVDKLVVRGLVRRRPGTKDRREVLLALTPAGRRLIARIFPPHAAAIRQAVGGLSPRRQAQALRLLRTLGLEAAGRLHHTETP